MRLALQRPATSYRAFAGAALLATGILLSCASKTEDFNQVRVKSSLAERNSTLERLSPPLLPDSTRSSMIGILANSSVSQLPGEADLVVLGVMASSARNGGPKEARTAVYYLRKCAGSDTTGKGASAYASSKIAKVALEDALNNPSIDPYTRDIILEYLKNPKKSEFQDEPPCCERH